MAGEKAKNFLIIDANALAHRAFHAIPPLETKAGVMTNAVYGFFLLFLRAVKEINPDFVLAAFDSKEPTFRHKDFAQYKAKRKKAPDELYAQIDLIKQGLSAFSVPVFVIPGFEADDIIATACFLIQKKRIMPAPEIVILSGDMDNLQLVNDKVKVYTMRKGIKDTILYGIEEVEQRYGGLLPEQVVDYKAIAGDASDNIPGIVGVGDKTAIALLLKFGSLENLYKEIEQETEKAREIKPGLLQKIKNYQEQAFVCQKLATMRSDVPMGLDFQGLIFGDFNDKEIQDFFKQMEFTTLWGRFLELQENQTGKKQAGLLAESAESIKEEVSRLEQQGILSPQIADLELKLYPIVKQMENTGVKVDIQKLNLLSLFLEKKIANRQKKIYQLSKKEFNINSPQQISEILFVDLAISPLGLRKTPGGAMSTNVEELKKVKNQHSVVAYILQYRKLLKLKTGFVDALPRMINSKTGKAHPHFHQLGTETGRMSCSDPNLQNIPVKGELGRAIRKCFVAEAGFCLLSADYSQVELRIAAWLANDKTTAELFKQGKDIHTQTASRLFNIKEAEVSKSQREFAKTLNYAILYGMGANGLARRTGIERKKAKDFIERYFTEFKELANFVEEQKAKARETGFSQTYFGRKRFLNEINSSDSRSRAQAERIAVNMPVQGTCADIMKMAMTALAGIDTRLILQIHDELLFEIKRDKIKECAKKIKDIMENIVKDKVFLAVDIKVGDNWGEMEKVGEK